MKKKISGRIFGENNAAQTHPTNKNLLSQTPLCEKLISYHTSLGAAC